MWVSLSPISIHFNEFDLIPQPRKVLPYILKVKILDAVSINFDIPLVYLYNTEQSQEKTGLARPSPANNAHFLPGLGAECHPTQGI